MRAIGEVVRVDHSDADVADALLELQRRAYEVEAALIGSRDIPPLTETLEELQSSRETFLAVFVEGRIAGTVAYRLLRDTIDIHRLAVDPTCFRGGIGTALVRAAPEGRAFGYACDRPDGRRQRTSRSLYLREGFEQADELEVAPGLCVTRYCLRLR